MEAKEFVLAFVNKAVPIETKYELLLKAADLHAKRYKDCMNGMGIDRHLFSLYIVCKGQGYVSIVSVHSIVFFVSCKYFNVKDREDPIDGLGKVKRD